MNPFNVLSVLGSFGLVIAIAMWIAIVAASLLFPFALFSLAKSARTIARELARANDYREHYERGVRPGPLGT